MSTVTNKSYVVAVDQHHHDKNRRFLRLVLLIVGIIILFAALFLAVVIYRGWRTGSSESEISLIDSNRTEFDFNQSSSNYQFVRACQHGRVNCQFGATCTEQDQCQCIFNCNDEADGEAVQDDETSMTYPNKCRLNEARCNVYYDKLTSKTGGSACSSIVCSHGAKCLIDSNDLPRCYCPDHCDEYDRTIFVEGRVCGTDNETYQTLCDLQKRACQRQETLNVVHVGECHCQSHLPCPTTYQPICASNLQEYPNECEMNKHACQSKIHLSKLHEGQCDFYEQQRKIEVCKTLACFNGKTCMIEDGIGVCRCLFNCSSSDQNKICGSNGIIYPNQCELERENCAQESRIVSVDYSNCVNQCNSKTCPYGQCLQRPNGQFECQCTPCPTIYSTQDTICGNNGITYSSHCHLQHDACTRRVEIQAIHMGQCNNCHNVTCPFYGQCRSEQGTHSCVCPSINTCSAVRNSESYSICASNQQLFSSQCEMNIRSCELQTHLYAIAPHHCTKTQDEPEYSHDCAYDEPVMDYASNRTIECDTLGRCPMNSYCSATTNRCCVKVITAILPYRTCLRNEHCGRNMICLSGLCECARQDFVPARKRRECISVPHLSMGLSCADSSYGCCNDNVTISPSVDRRGCPEYCNCHPSGSLQSACDPITGACYCRPAVGGSSCSHCENEYWGFSRILSHNNTGCTPCGCHPYGSTRKDCLQDTGECSCQPFATGRQCDRCLNSSLTLTDRGCVNLQKNRRRPRTCRDLICLFEGICQMANGQPRCTCFHVTCTHEEQRSMDICASDGRTYKSKCAIKRQQCLKQYEIGLIYPGVCTAADVSMKDQIPFEEDFLPIENENVLDYSMQMAPIDSKRCATNADCGENMVCLSEFCECAKQKYKRIPGPRCVAPHSNLLASNYTLNPVRRTTMGACMRRTPCENQATCIDRPDGNYKCLCAFGWQGRHCHERFEVTIPHFNRQSYFELKTPTINKYNDQQLLRIDLVFASENQNGLLLYTDDKLTEFYFIISIRNFIVDMTIRLENFISTIQLEEMIDLDSYARLQVDILQNELRARLNDGNISSRLLPFGSPLKNTLFLGGLPDSLNSLYHRFHLDEGFQGCIHEFSINERRITFNSSEHQTILSAQNIDECFANPCRTGVASCRNGTRCIPIRNNDANSYKCLCNDYLSFTSSTSNSDCSVQLIDHCSLRPCESDQQCVHVYPNNYTCICLNCSSSERFVAAFYSNSYIKRPALQPIEQTGKFSMEIWFLTESASGLLIYSDHLNSKKGYFAVFIQRRLVVCHLMIGSKTISLSSRFPIELNKWHRCLIEIHGQKLTLMLNQEPAVMTFEVFSNNILWPRSFTFIGNLPIQYRSFDMLPNSIVLDGFRGAIQKMTINNQSWYDIRQDAIEIFNISQYYGYPCHPNPCTLNDMCQQTDMNNFTCQARYAAAAIKDISVELDGRANLAYPYAPANLNRNYFKLLLRTKTSSGLIFYIGDTVNVFSQYLSLTLVNGFIQFTAKIDSNATEVSLVSKLRVDDGQWHRIELERFRRRITMKLDENYPRRALLTTTKQTEFRPFSSSMHVGGFHRLCGQDEQHCRTFRGCLKNFLIDKTYLDFFHDEINQYHALRSCQSIGG